MSTPSFNTTPKTVFVVGAGASQEAGLPIGSELKKSIATALDIRAKRGGSQLISGDYLVLESLRLEAAKNPTHTDLLASLQNAAWRIRDAMPLASSIDTFIDNHSEDKQIELCGKLAIVRTILEAEAKSHLFVEFLGDHQLKFDQLENTWFNSFWQLLIQNCQSSDLATRLKSVTFVIFNYDRCIEHFLYYAIQNYYGMKASEVAQLLQHLELFLHPYGTVGSLPWLNENNAIDYGDTPNSNQLLRLANQIKTYTEGTDKSSSDVNAIRSHMKTYDKLVFLGFAFHPLNMELLRPSAAFKSPHAEQRVFGTAYDISDSDADSIRTMLTKGVPFVNRVKIRNDLTCSQLFHEYGRDLSFA